MAGWSVAAGAPAGRVRRLVGPAGLAAVASAALLTVALVDPEQPGHYPVCPTFALTGLYCPGCGGLRAVHALTHGDVVLALQRNPFVVLALPVAVWAYLAWVRRRALGRRAVRYPPISLLWLIGVILLGFTIMRNLPGLAWLAP